VAARRIPIQIPRKVMGRGRIREGQKTFIPIRINSAGVMPIIFAQSIIIVPGTLATFSNVQFLKNATEWFAPGSTPYYISYAVLIVFFTYHWIGVRKQGFVPYLKHFAGPVPTAIKPLMFVIEIISHCARPLSLSLRLFGNMMAGHILLAIFFFMMGFDGMLGWALSGTLGGIVVGAPAALIMVVFVVGFLLPLKILVAFIQTFIFCKLAMLYIAAAVEEAEHH